MGMTEIKTWTMKDGTEIAIKDMDDRHLINSYKMAQRLSEEAQDSWNGYYPQGEMAQYYWDQHIDEAMDVEFYWRATMEDLLPEIKRRNLLTKIN